MSHSIPASSRMPIPVESADAGGVGQRPPLVEAVGHGQ